MAHTFTSPKSLLDAFIAGVKDARDYKLLKDNPYDRLDRQLWLEWRRGYLTTLVGANENKEVETT